MSLEPGSRIGRYEIIGLLGAGGMGQVHRARDTRLGREVAIKLLRDSDVDPRALARFETEARAVSALDHPHIVTLYDIDQDGSRTFLVMELIDGAPLRAELDRPMAVDRAVRFAYQIADALAVAHGRGIVHRDLKPENVLITADGRVKVLDFGLARPLGGDGGEETLSTATRLTRPGVVLGTLGYLSPEMAAGGEAGAAADQFSLGCILYEMLAGRPAFPGGSAAERLAALLRDQPPALGSLRPELPTGLVELVERCLSKDPAGRHPDMARLRDALRALLEETDGERPGRERPTRKRSRLPASRTRFFGREEEREEIRRLLLDPTVRLVTLTGAGGTGKTRLALRVAEQLEGERGVFFVPLATVTDPEAVMAEVARALGAAPAGIDDALRAIVDAVEESERPVVIVLDNFEHLAAAAPMIGELLETAPSLSLLVTSRELLHLYGEYELPVPPLDVPDPDQLPPIDELSRLPAVALFVDRAQAARRSFRLDSENAAAIAELCHRLDGLPLALELAAARTRILTPQSIVARLGQRLEVLTGGARDRPMRQRTLRDTIDWSHGLLEPGEQAAFRRLAVFAGGFTLEAAEAVVDPLGRLERAVPELVISLVEKSLVQQVSVTREARFGMLQVIREYARDRLRQAGEEDRTHKAHAAYFMVLAEELGPLCRREDGASLTIDTEHDNFLAALDFLVASDRAEWGLRTMLALFPGWERGQHMAEARNRLCQLVELPSAAAHPELLAKGLYAAGSLVHASGDFEGARRLQQQSLELHRRLGNPLGVLVALNGLSICHVDLGEYVEARRCLEEALEGWAERQDDVGYARSLSNLANVAKAEGRYQTSRELHRESAARFRKLGDRQGTGWALNHEADVARIEGDLEAAVELYGQALEAFREVGEPWGIASSLADLGRVHRQRGERQQATELYRQALRSFAELGHRRGVAHLFDQLAEVLIDHQRVEPGLRLIGAAAAIRDRLGLRGDDRSHPDLSAALDRARERLGSEPAAAERRRGEQMRWRDAVDYALQESAADA